MEGMVLALIVSVGLLVAMTSAARQRRPHVLPEHYAERWFAIDERTVAEYRQRRDSIREQLTCPVAPWHGSLCAQEVDGLIEFLDGVFVDGTSHGGIA